MHFAKDGEAKTETIVVIIIVHPCLINKCVLSYDVFFGNIRRNKIKERGQVAPSVGAFVDGADYCLDLRNMDNFILQKYALHHTISSKNLHHPLKKPLEICKTFFNFTQIN